MIPRYSRPKMSAVWTPEARYGAWLRVEIATCDELARRGEIPKKAAEKIRKTARFDVARIDAIEEKVKHDVIAFLTNVAEEVGPEARYIHLGLTSSDVLDTAFALQLSEAADLLIADIVMPVVDGLALALKASAAYPALRIILMTGYRAELERAHNLGAFIHGILAKPFAAEELRAAVTKALAEAPPADTTP